MKRKTRTVPQKACAYGCGYTANNYTAHEKHDHSQCPCGVVRCQEIKQGHENCKFDKIDPVTFFAPKPESFLTLRSASEPIIDLVSRAFKTLSLDGITTLKSLEDSQLSAIAIQALG